MVFAYLLARAGVEVLVLEKHADFFRDFRGDTIHPSTLELMYELGLAGRFLEPPHQEYERISAQIDDFEVPCGGLHSLADALQIPGADAAVGFSEFYRRARQGVSRLSSANGIGSDRT